MWQLPQWLWSHPCQSIHPHSGHLFAQPQTLCFGREDVGVIPLSIPSQFYGHLWRFILSLWAVVLGIQVGNRKEGSGTVSAGWFWQILPGGKGGFSRSNNPRGMKGKGSYIEDPRARNQNYPDCLLHNQKNSVIHEGKTFHCVFFFLFWKLTDFWIHEKI